MEVALYASHRNLVIRSLGGLRYLHKDYTSPYGSASRERRNQLEVPLGIPETGRYDREIDLLY